MSPSKHRKPSLVALWLICLTALAWEAVWALGWQAAPTSVSIVAKPSPSGGGSCTTTLSAGANLDTAITSAASGDTICLNTGSYGSQTINGIGGTKSPRVTIRSVSAPLSGTIPGPPSTPPTITGAGATMSLSLGGVVNGLTFDGIIITGGGWGDTGGTVKNVTIQNSYFNSVCYEVITANNASMNALLDSNYHLHGNNCAASGGEGRLSVRCVSCGSTPLTGTIVQVTNSRFENLSPYTTGTSDGMQIGSYGTIVGPGNLFIGIQQTADPTGNICHCDAIQGYGASHTTITGNFFYNNGTNIVFFDGSGGTDIITHNVVAFGPNGESSGNAVWLSIGPNGTITHNTFRDIPVTQGHKPADPPNSNLLVQDNIFVNADFGDYSGGGDCTSCTYNNNLFDASSTPRGSAQILGSPTFTGGASPTTYLGFRLTPASLGYLGAVNGTDLGPTY